MEPRVWSTNSRVVPQTSKIKIWFPTLATSKHSKLNITTALGDPLFGNYGGRGTGAVGGQTVGSMGCAANQRNIVCQSNYALKAINGAGNDLTRLENNLTEIRECRFDKVREIRFKSRFFFLLGLR